MVGRAGPIGLITKRKQSVVALNKFRTNRRHPEAGKENAAAPFELPQSVATRRQIKAQKKAIRKEIKLI